MNIQDVAEFIDLVKNPDRYQAMLDRLVAEQIRLNAVIETVGLASDIEQIRKDTLRQEEKGAQTIKDKLHLMDNKRAQEEIEYQIKTKAAQEEAKKYNAMMEDQKETLAENKLINKNIKAIEKSLIVKTQELDNQTRELAAIKAEYEEKLAKLRSVMV